MDAHARLSQRVRQAAPAERDAAGTITLRRPRVRGLERAVREPAAAAVQAAHRRSRPAPAGVVPARAGPGRLRSGLARAAGRGGAAVGPVDRAAEGGLAGGVRALEDAVGWTSSSPSTCGWTAIYVKAGLEKDKAAMLVRDRGAAGRAKVVLAVESGYRESTESWAAVLRDLKARGLRAPRAADRRRSSRDLGRRGDGLPRGARAAVLEPSHRERARHSCPRKLPGRGPRVC